MAKKSEAVGYKGNIALKPINQAVEWTEETLNEYTKCSLDVKYFINTYVRIENVDDGLVNFKLREYQNRMVDSIVENRYSIFLCARQIGKCCNKNEIIRLRNKKTGEVQEISFSDFFRSQKNV